MHTRAKFHYGGFCPCFGQSDLLYLQDFRKLSIGRMCP